MQNTDAKLFDGAFGVVTGALAVFVLAFGIFLLPDSALGGAWIAAIGLSLVGAVVVGSTWGRQRLGLPPAGGRSAALGFVAVAVLLAVAFVAVNYASFSGPESTSSGVVAALGASREPGK